MRSSHSIVLLLLIAAVLVAAVWTAMAFGGDATVPSAPTAIAPEPRPEPDDHAPAGAPQRTPAAMQRADTTLLRGRVVDAYGEPVAGALVGETTSDAPTSTAGDGHFELTVARGPGTTSLLVLARDQAPLLSQHELPAVAVHELGDLQLQLGGDLRGRISDAAGTGLPGATATLHVLGNGAPLDRDSLHAPQVADARGDFVFAHLAPGTYRVAASAPGRQTAQSPVVTVRDGSPTELAPLVLDEGHELRGIVLGPAGEAVPAASVRVRQRAARTRVDVTVETAADGRFVCTALPAGALDVAVEKQGFLRRELTGVDAREELVVQLSAGLRLTGIAVDARSGQPVERFAAMIRRLGDVAPAANGSMEQQLQRQIAVLRQAATTAADDAQRTDKLRLADELEVRLRRVHQQASSRPLVVPADVGPVLARPEGAFTFEGLEEGLYAVAVSSPAHQFAQQEPILVQQGAAPELRFALVAGHALVGNVVAVTSGAPVPGATVDLMRSIDASAPSDPAGGRSLFPWLFARDVRPSVAVMSARTGADGAFRLLQVPPGRYSVAVHDARFADFDGDEFDVVGDRTDVHIALDALAALTGRVLNVPAVLQGKVSVLVFGGHGAMRTVTAAADGSYRCESLQAGSYVVRAFPSDAPRYVDRLFGELFPEHAGDVDPDRLPPLDVTLTPGETRRFDPTIDVPATGTVRGQVTINAQPGRDASVVLRPEAGAAPGSGGLALRGKVDESGQFQVADVPAGNYAFVVSSATRQELHRQALTVAAGEIQVVSPNISAGGVRGRVSAPDTAEPVELRGYLWLIPGANEAPADLYEFQKQNRVHRVSVRNGAFEDLFLTPGPATVLIDLRGRRRVVATVTVPATDVLTVDFVAGVRQP
ncbi:MAG TPA: carboxypeptidase-like regulatory domain-containing protein [Planctomycetota bacterium]|nr:carboxypeptidase-like regulatory domain-containing protein [Planctomycetota bacterium]